MTSSFVGWLLCFSSPPVQSCFLRLVDTCRLTPPWGRCRRSSRRRLCGPEGWTCSHPRGDRNGAPPDKSRRQELGNDERLGQRARREWVNDEQHKVPGVPKSALPAYCIECAATNGTPGTCNYWSLELIAPISTTWSGPADVHGEVEQSGVSVPHPELAQQHPDQLPVTWSNVKKGSRRGFCLLLV